MSGVDRCSLAGENGFQETGHQLFPTEGGRSKKIQGGVGVNGENEGKVEIFLEREEVSGEWRDILVVKRGEKKKEEEKKEEEASDRNVSRLRIKVIAFFGFSPLCTLKLHSHTGHIGNVPRLQIKVVAFLSLFPPVCS